MNPSKWLPYLVIILMAIFVSGCDTEDTNIDLADTTETPDTVAVNCDDDPDKADDPNKCIPHPPDDDVVMEDDTDEEPEYDFQDGDECPGYGGCVLINNGDGTWSCGQPPNGHLPLLLEGTPASWIPNICFD